jgi:hypothetical protein
MANFESSTNSENYLYPTAFKFTIARLPGVTYHCQSANIPGVTVNAMSANNPRSGRTLKIPSQNLQFGDLDISFLIDETMTNWIELYNWMQALRVVNDWETVRPFTPNIATGTLEAQLDTGTMVVLSSANNAVRTFRFNNMFPVELSSVSFNAAIEGAQTLTATAKFAFEFFTIDQA